MSESFFSRWSRQKRAAAETLPPATPALPPGVEPGQAPQSVAEAPPAAPPLPQTQPAAPLPTLDDVSAASSVVYGTVLVTGMQHLLLGNKGDLGDRAEAVSKVILHGIGGQRGLRQSRRTTTGGT